MTNFILRSEELQDSKILDYYVGTVHDSVSINTIGELAASNESAVMKAYYVGEVRAKQMKNAAYAALFEYLLG